MDLHFTQLVSVGSKNAYPSDTQIYLTLNFLLLATSVNAKYYLVQKINSRLIGIFAAISGIRRRLLCKLHKIISNNER